MQLRRSIKRVKPERARERENHRPNMMTLKNWEVMKNEQNCERRVYADFFVLPDPLLGL